jgi:hypothetical protein
VVLASTAEGNVTQPSLTPSTTPFLNGVPLTILTASGSQFTASFPNFYTTSGNGAITALSYTNNSDTGTATLMTNPLIVTYNDPNGALQIWNTIYYTVGFNKITLTVGSLWPITDRRQDCIQISYWAGSAATDTTQVPPRLLMAIMFLASHFWENRTIISTDPTTAEFFPHLPDSEVKDGTSTFTQRSQQVSALVSVQLLRHIPAAELRAGSGRNAERANDGRTGRPREHFSVA